MIIVSGFLRLSPADLDTVREAARATIAATRAEEGCHIYAFADDLTEPGLVRIYEEWDSRETLAAHGQTAHIAAWRETLKGVTVVEQRLKIVEVASEEPFS
ncbi:putative quinol monooxygenase [Aureimonas jatrophae]|jgi:quinol monooxygenase YgiN|uniref:Quinol monooxygenase YgiN n=1 Tax=Aureimonas jatrophae TaxID=1166073 RepID=A0A1H0EXT6_9HYPH|nr:putative quinol monooxygenase [Aureimonas jatrophae]MBB3950267.1 quinol monooxygenase YgiN [Aureimonas jatrophae]SDN87153.1 Quinol monooxygenase YgiN [Aureimonas jatrophae]